LRPFWDEEIWKINIKNIAKVKNRLELYIVEEPVLIETQGLKWRAPTKGTFSLYMKCPPTLAMEYDPASYNIKRAVRGVNISRKIICEMDLVLGNSAKGPWKVCWSVRGHPYKYRWRERSMVCNECFFCGCELRFPKFNFNELFMD
jgi:hypothetical protein